MLLSSPSFAPKEAEVVVLRVGSHDVRQSRSCCPEGPLLQRETGSSHDLSHPEDFWASPLKKKQYTTLIQNQSQHTFSSPSQWEVLLFSTTERKEMWLVSSTWVGFFLTSNREHYNDLQRHTESKLCCKRLSLESTKNHREKMQEAWNSQQQRLIGKYGVVFLGVKVTFMLYFPMRNYKLSKEFESLVCTHKCNLSGTALVKMLLRF